jgi:hypothetical protein
VEINVSKCGLYPVFPLRCDLHPRNGVPELGNDLGIAARRSNPNRQSFKRNAQLGYFRQIVI